VNRVNNVSKTTRGSRSVDTMVQYPGVSYCTARAGLLREVRDAREREEYCSPQVFYEDSRRWDPSRYDVGLLVPALDANMIQRVVSLSRREKTVYAQRLVDKLTELDDGMTDGDEWSDMFENLVSFLLALEERENGSLFTWLPVGSVASHYQVHAGDVRRRMFSSRSCGRCGSVSCFCCQLKHMGGSLGEYPREWEPRWKFLVSLVTCWGLAVLLSCEYTAVAEVASSLFVRVVDLLSSSGDEGDESREDSDLEGDCGPPPRYTP